MTTATLEGLREKEETLKLREKELMDTFHALPNDADLPRRRDEVRKELGEIEASLTRLSPQIAACKEETKKARLVELLHSSEYVSAVTGALEDLAGKLSAWLPLLTMTDAARRQAVTLPLPPASVSALWLEGREYVRTLIRRGVITDRDVPAPLKALLEGSGR
jgi:hypothetical protein